MNESTLEKILSELGKTEQNEERMHAAMLLSYAESIYDVMRKSTVPSPLYRVSYDKTNHVISLDETYGKSLVPKKDSLDISLEDEIFCSNIRDMPILLEGETGVGKTFTAMKYVSAILDKENFFAYRLSANAFMNNLFSPFQEGKMDNGMPVINPRIDIIEKTAAVIVDEINRGDSNETLQLFDNEMHLGGKIYKFGIPIPEFEFATIPRYNEKSGRLKKLLIITAQNPSNADDSKFTQTLQLDAAVDNRLLKTYVGNAAPSAGSVLWLGEDGKKPHEEFMEKFKKRTADYLRISKKIFDNLEKDWLPMYSWITEARRTDKPVLYSALELSDILIATFSGNLIDYFNYEKGILNDWEAKLKKGVTITETLHETDNIKKIHEITSSFKVPIIFRDIVQVKRLADVLATLRNIKNSLRAKNSLEEYLGMKKYVSIREVAGATALLARNKQKSESRSPLDAINQVLGNYVSLIQDYMKESELFTSNFDMMDPDQGIKRIAIDKSLGDTIQKSGGVDSLVNNLTEQAKLLRAKISNSEEIRNVIIARNVADLMTLCGFLTDYKDEISPMLKGYSKKTQITDIIEDLGKFYYNKQRKEGMILPEIYQHRIQRTLGVSGEQ